MKILLLTGSLNQGGAEFQLLSLARLFMLKGLDTEVIAITEYNYYLPYVKEYNIRYSCVPNEGSDLVRLIRAVRFINSKKPDIVISFIKRVSQVAILARCISLFRFKLIISERTSLVRPWHDLFYFNLALFANRVTVNSLSKYNYIRKRFPLLENRTVFIPNLLDIERFLKIKKNDSFNGFTRVSYVGRISPEKNIINLIQAVKLVSDRKPKVFLCLYGEAHNHSYLSEVQKFINETNAKDLVKYMGPVQNVTEVYAETDLLCLVSFYEGFSNVLSEALACGIPLIVSNIDENVFLVEDHKNGFCVDPNKPEEIAEGIFRFTELNTLEVNTMSRVNKLKAIEFFNEDSIFNIYSKLFDSIND